MAANKEIMKALETLRLDRPGRVYGVIAAVQTIDPPAEGHLTAALRELAATYREEADLWSRSGAKGWKSKETENYLIAAAVDSVAAQLDNAGGGAALSVSDSTPIGPDPANTATVASLDALVNDAIAEGRGAVRVDPQTLADTVKANGIERKTAFEWNDDPRVDPFVVSWSDFGNSAHRQGMTINRNKLITLAEFEKMRDGGAVTTGRRTPRIVQVDMTAPPDMGEALGVTPDQYAEGRLTTFADAVKTYSEMLPQHADLPSVTVDVPILDPVLGYLSGAVDTLPGLVGTLVPSSVHDMTMKINFADPTDYEVPPTEPCCVNMLDPDEDPAPWCDCRSDDDMARGHAGPCKRQAHLRTDHDTPAEYLPPMPKTWESETMTADGHRPPGNIPQAPPLGQPGDMGTGYDHSYIPSGGRRITFAELLTQVPAASLPTHVSNSQIDTVGDCATKYRLQRVENLPQIPQWANIGGSAFHAAVEAFERTVAGMLNRGSDDLVDSSAYDVEKCWKHHFEAEIAKVQASTTVPISVWRAARKGGEGRAWWEINGPLMLRRYLDARPAEQTFDIPVMGVGGIESVSGIEADLTVDVPTPYGPIQFNSKLDRVTIGHAPDHPERGALIIRDYKTSYERPTDTTQLGDYAHALRLTFALQGSPLADVPIFGTFFDARRGEWTKPVDLLQVHPFEAFQYRVTTAHAQKRALTTGPTPARPSSYCGGCSVRYACPIMAAKS